MSPGNIRLHLESRDGSPAKEYRIEDGNAESKRLMADLIVETFGGGLHPGN